jgi:hypothetical protein
MFQIRYDHRSIATIFLRKTSQRSLPEHDSRKLVKRLKRIITELENMTMTKIGGSNLNRKALSSVQKPQHQDYDARILQPIPHDPVTFVNIISYEKIQLRILAFIYLLVPDISLDTK